MKPVVGTPSCEYHHQGVVITGELQFVTDDGVRKRVRAGQAYDVPPGHDGMVIGEEAAIAVEFAGVRGWGKPPETGERVLATLVVTDIADSTAKAAELDDSPDRSPQAQSAEVPTSESGRGAATALALRGSGSDAMKRSTAAVASPTCVAAAGPNASQRNRPRPAASKASQSKNNASCGRRCCTSPRTQAVSTTPVTSAPVPAPAENDRIPSPGLRVGPGTCGAASSRRARNASVSPAATPRSVVWSPDYDGKGKAWVRFDDDTDAILGGSRVER